MKRLIKKIKVFGLEIAVKILYRLTLLKEKDDIGKGWIIICFHYSAILKSRNIEDPSLARRYADFCLHILEPLTYKTMRTFRPNVYEATRKILKEIVEDER